MIYRTDNKIRKYVKGYGFMSFAKNLGSKYGEKVMNKGISASKKFNQSKYGKMLKNQGTEFEKIAGKKILAKSAETTGDWIEFKIADKITSFKSKEKPEVIETEKFPQEEQEIIILADKRQQILNDLRLF